MPHPRLTALTLALTALLATPTALLAQDDETDQITSYVLADGRSVRGTVLEYDDTTQTVKMHVRIAAGSMTASGNLEDFSPLSGYRILRDHLDPDCVEDHVRLAEFAVQNDLIKQARTHLKTARKLADDKEIPGYLEAQLVERAYATVELAIEKLLDQGETREAREIVANLRAADVARIPASRVEALDNLIEVRVAHEEALAQAKQDIEAEQEAVAYRERATSPLEELIERAQTRRRSAMLGSKSFSSAHRDLQRAVADCERVFDRSARLRKQNPQDATLAEQLTALEGKARTTRDDCLLAMGSLDLTRGNFNRAMASVNKVLADEPEHKRALAMRARIEQSANQPWGNGWIGGRVIR